MSEKPEPDWRAVADTLATELRKHGWDHAESDYVEPVAAALAAYDDATGVVDAEMAREFHAVVAAILRRWRAGLIAVGLNPHNAPQPDEIADAILEEFGLER